MKFSYLLVKRLLPGVPPVKKLAKGIENHSFEVEAVEGDMLDLKIPANQYSAMASHYGIAREASAIFGVPFKEPARKTAGARMRQGFVKIAIDEPALCPRYAARVFDIKDNGDSSLETKKILRTCGINPVNAVVDIMNLVMLETGQPLHAFDAEKIKGGIRVRRAKKGETIETLDGKTVALDASVLVIADEEKPQAIAGIKGGKASGVTKTTRRIIVEAANFDGAMIYRAARSLKLATDAGARFAHGIAPALVPIGLDRATALLEKIGARLIDAAEAGNARTGDALIDFNPAAFERLIGIPASVADVRRRFAALGFGFETPALKKSGKKNGALRVRIPAWRNDIENPEDLYEEAARLAGYDALPKRPPVLTIQPAHEDDAFILGEKIRDIATGLAIDETYNNSFYGPTAAAREKFAALFGMDDVHAEVLHPVSDDLKFLRKSLLPLLFENFESNARYFENVRLFEIGKVFGTIAGTLKEKTSLGIFIAAKKDRRLALELKGAADEILKGLGIGDFSFVPDGAVIRIASAGGAFGMIGTETMRHGWECAYAEFDLEKISAMTEESRTFVPLQRFPLIVRDISVLVGRDARIGSVIAAIEAAHPALIEAVELIDEYKDEKLGGKQSITFRVIFQAGDRTLTDDEVNRVMEKIAQALRSKFAAAMR